MKIVVVALTEGGRNLAEQISKALDNCTVDSRELPVFDKIKELWAQDVDAIICVMATGIVVRTLSKLCFDKMSDPCVLVLDEKGDFVISLLSGHIGGGNELARTLASKIDAQAVITTASDVTGHTALDLWAKKNCLQVTDKAGLTEKSAKLINAHSLTLYTEHEVESLPVDFVSVATPELADIIVSDRLFPESTALILCPCALTVGLGCNRGTSVKDFIIAVDELFSDNSLRLDSIASFASIDLKHDEEGMLAFAAGKKLPLKFYAKEELNQVEDVSTSAVVFAATGAKGVAEPAAILAAKTPTGTGTLIVRKRKWKDVTAAVAIKMIRLVA